MNRASVLRSIVSRRTGFAPFAGLLVFGALAVMPARADEDIDFARPPTSEQLDDLTREIGASVFGAKLAPAEGLGPVRVEVQVGAVATKVHADETFWRRASGGESRSGNLVLGRGSVRVGLPAGIDLGAFYERAPGTNVTAEGGSVKWAFVKGSTSVPAVAARVSYARLSGVDSLRAKATGLDVSISKGLGPVTPYGGVGRLWLDSRVSDVSGFPGARVKASPAVNQVFVGTRISAGWFRLMLEAQRAAGLSSYAATVGFKVP